MSLIFDALNRADQERNEEHSTPNLQVTHAPIEEPSSPLRRWFVEAAIVIIALAVAVYALVDRSNPSAEPTAVTTAIATSVTTPIATPIATPVTTSSPQTPLTATPNTPASAPPAPVTTSVTEPVAAPVVGAVVETVVETVVATAVAPVVKMEKSAPAPIPIPKPIKSKPNTAISSLYQQRAEAPATIKPDAKIERSSVDASAATPIIKSTATGPVVDNSQTILQQIPLLVQMSQRFRRSVPSIDYTVHVYSEESNSGIVNLNGSVRRIGSKLAPELRVIAILRDSVVLDYKGTQFRLMALNSWINF